MADGESAREVGDDGTPEREFELRAEVVRRLVERQLEGIERDDGEDLRLAGTGQAWPIAPQRLIAVRLEGWRGVAHDDAGLAGQGEIAQRECRARGLLLGDEDHLDAIDDAGILLLPGDPVAEEEADRKGSRRCQRLAGGVERAEVEDPVARADDLIADRSAGRAGDHERGAVALGLHARLRMRDRQRLGPGRKLQLDMAGDVLELTRVDARDEAHDLARFHPLGRGALERAGLAVALAAAGFRSQQFLTRLRLHAVDEEAGPLRLLGDVRDGAGEAVDDQLEADRGVRPEANLTETEPERPLDLIDLLGERRGGIERAKRGRRGARPEDERAQVDAFGDLRRLFRRTHPAESRQDGAKQLVEDALEIFRERAIDRELDGTARALRVEREAVEQRRHRRRRLRPARLRFAQRLLPAR